MQQYPSINAEVRRGLPVYIFDKLDGSNIRCEWHPKKGFHKFGSRHVLLDETNKILGPSVNLIRSKYEKDLTDIFKKEKWEETTCFFEYYGTSSFAGWHDENEEKIVSLIDIHIFKHGLIKPNDFVKKIVGKVDTATFLHFGNVTKDIENEIREGVFAGMTFEGVICKSVPERRFHGQTMFKIKNKAWYEKLHAYCGDDKDMFEKLK